MNTSSLKEQQQRKIKTQPGFFAALDQPEEDNFYADCIKHPNVLKVVALSGGYSPKEANEPPQKSRPDSEFFAGAVGRLVTPAIRGGV
jgi:fructose-bisphosphate aldolase class 1